MSAVNRKKKAAAPHSAPDALLLASAVAERVQIADVRLVSCECWQTPRVTANQLEFRLSHEAQTTWNEKAKAIAVIAKFGLTAKPTGAPDTDVAVQIRVAFLVTYSACDLGGLEDDTFKSFGELNGVYNAWPYWRELVQSAMARMGLPPLTIPVFRIMPVCTDTGGSKETASPAKRRKPRASAGQVGEPQQRSRECAASQSSV